MRKHLIFLLFFTISGAPAGLADMFSPPGKGWIKSKSKQEFCTYFRETRGGDTREVVMVGVIQAPAEECFKVVGEFEQYPEFMPYVKYSEIVHQEKINNFKNIYHVFFILDPPLVSTRYYTLKLVNEKSPEGRPGAFRCQWTQELGVYKKTPSDFKFDPDAGIEIKFNNGYWLFEPLKQGKRTRVTYYLWTNPGGKLPIWIANKANAVSLPDLWESIKGRLAGEKK